MQSNLELGVGLSNVTLADVGTEYSGESRHYTNPSKSPVQRTIESIEVCKANVKQVGTEGACKHRVSRSDLASTTENTLGRPYNDVLDHIGTTIILIK